MDNNEFNRLATLARIHLSSEEKEKLKVNIESILGHIEALTKIPTENIEPCVHPLHGANCPLRSDEPDSLLSRKQLLENSPEHVGGMIKVPAVLQ